MEYNVYCLSNASTDIFNNVLTSFKNLFPTNLDIGDEKFEIGLVSVGIHLNYELSPGLFQVRSNIISDVPNGDDYSTIAYSSSLPHNLKNKYFYHHVNRINYYPIRHTNIATISVKLTDVLGNPLPIKSGQPSIVHFHLREKEKNMDHDITYVRLDSKVDAKLDFINTNNSFWTHLKHPIHLNAGATMALTDISFPNNFKTVVNKIENKFKEKIYFTLNMSKYPSSSATKLETFSAVVPNLICYNEVFIAEKFNEIVPEDIKKQVRFEIEDKHLVIVTSAHAAIAISIPKFVIEILGLRDLELDITNPYFTINQTSDTITIGIDKDSKYVSPDKIQLCKRILRVMVLYTNFVQHSIVGNNFYPILKIVPTNYNKEKKEQDYTSIHFDHLEFIKCNVNYLDNMKFELRGLDGDLIEFGNDRRIVLNIVIKNPK